VNSSAAMEDTPTDEHNSAAGMAATPMDAEEKLRKILERGLKICNSNGASIRDRFYETRVSAEKLFWTQFYLCTYVGRYTR
jgi:hypothetical protein